MGTDILRTIINFVVTGVLGYLVATLKTFKKKKKEKEDAILKTLESLDKRLGTVEQDELDNKKADLSNKFYVYNAMDEVDDYLAESYRKECEKYFSRGGDSWIHNQYEKSFEWDIKPTGYLK